MFCFPQKIFTAILSLLLFSGCAFDVSAYKIRSTLHDGEKYLYLQDIAGFYGMKLSRETKSCTLSSKYSKVNLQYDSKLASINDVNVYLSFPVIVKKIDKKWDVLLSEKDFLLLLDPILRKSVVPKQRVRTIVIDPGHGGKDSGALGKYSKEKDIALSISRQLAAVLKKAGYKVILTRNRDVYLNLADRPAVCERFNGNIFISIHCNAVHNKTVSGIETFIYSPKGTSSTYGGSFAKAGKGNKYNKNNARLGYSIQKQLTLMQSPDRGLKHSKFKVLRMSPVPAVLVETGFISSSSEESLLRNKNYQAKLAYRIAQGILAYSAAVKPK